jgi:hypothetical protein
VVATLAAGSIVKSIPSKEADHPHHSTRNAILFIFGSVLLLTSFLFHQRFDQYGLVLEKYNGHDALWHVALMKSIDRSLPVENPLLAGVPVTGYHYFTDIFWVGVHQTTGAEIEHLYFFISPIVLSALLAASIYLLAQSLMTNKTLQFLAAGVGLWAGGLAFYASWLFPQARAEDSVFWLDQSVHYAINHQLVFSLVVTNVILWLILKSGRRYWWLIGLLLGSLAGIKVYAVLIYLPAMVLLGTWQLIAKREWRLLAGAVLASAIAGLILWSARSQLGWPFIWAPGWFIKTMFESGSHLNYPTWEIHRQLFSQTNNLPRLIIHWSWASALFLFGNLGIKLLGIILIPVLMIKTRFRNFGQYQQPIFWTLIALGAVLAPVLFIQKGIVWNTIQFMHFAQVPLALVFIWAVRASQLRLRWQALVMSVVIAISLPTTLLMVNFNLQPQNYLLYPIEVIDHARQLTNLSRDSEILVGSTLNQSAIIPAISGRSVWWSDPTILSILGQEALDRKVYIDQIESGETNCYAGQVFVYLEGQRPRTAECPLVIPPPPVIPANLE